MAGLDYAKIGRLILLDHTKKLSDGKTEPY